nr:MAG TPA: hypothetical protein [Caudoviricetes sp.]
MVTDGTTPMMYDNNADWLLWIVVLFALFSGNGFGFGRNGEGLTQAELQAGLYNQTTDRNLSDLRDAVCETNQNILRTSGNTDMAIANANYNSLEQFKDLQSALQNCCCENRLAIEKQTNTLATAIHAEGEATRGMIQADKIEQLRDQVYASNLALNNANLANTVINAVRPFPSPSYVVGSPYTSLYNPYNGCACSQV